MGAKKKQEEIGKGLTPWGVQVRILAKLSLGVYLVTDGTYTFQSALDWAIFY